METHVADMAFHLPFNQHSILLAFSAHERMAPIAQDPDPYAYISAINGCFFAKVARFI
jgi:hypothetical protein